MREERVPVQCYSILLSTYQYVWTRATHKIKTKSALLSCWKFLSISLFSSPLQLLSLVWLLIHARGRNKEGYHIIIAPCVLMREKRERKKKSLASADAAVASAVKEKIVLERFRWEEQDRRHPDRFFFREKNRKCIARCQRVNAAGWSIRQQPAM